MDSDTTTETKPSTPPSDEEKVSKKGDSSTKKTKSSKKEKKTATSTESTEDTEKQTSSTTKTHSKTHKISSPIPSEEPDTYIIGTNSGRTHSKHSHSPSSGGKENEKKKSSKDKDKDKKSDDAETSDKKKSKRRNTQTTSDHSTEEGDDSKSKSKHKTKHTAEPSEGLAPLPSPQSSSQSSTSASSSQSNQGDSSTSSKVTQEGEPANVGSVHTQRRKPEHTRHKSSSGVNGSKPSQSQSKAPVVRISVGESQLSISARSQTRNHNQPMLSQKQRTLTFRDLRLVDDGRTNAGKDLGGLISGRWRLTEVLGETGLQGKTFAGRSEVPGTDSSAQDIIVKEIKTRQFCTSQLSLLRKTFPTLITLNHPCLAHYRDLCFAGGRLYSVADFVTGMPLCELIKTRGSLCTEPLLAAVVGQALTALAYLHYNNGCSLFHGDIHTNNIIVDPNTGTAKLVDISLKRFSEMGGVFSASNSLYGRTNWLPPEVVNMFPGYCKGSDIWELGCACIEALAGVPPYADFKHQVSVLNAILTKTPHPAECVMDKVSEELKSFLNDCFAFEYEKRPSAKELLEHKFIKKFVSTEFNQENDTAFLDCCRQLAKDEIAKLKTSDDFECNLAKFYNKNAVFASVLDIDAEESLRLQSTILAEPAAIAERMFSMYPAQNAPSATRAGGGLSRRNRAGLRQKAKAKEAEAASSSTSAPTESQKDNDNTNNVVAPIDEAKEFEKLMCENVTPALKKCMDTQEYLLFVTNGIHEKYMSSRKRAEKTVQNNALSLLEQKRIQRDHTFILTKLRAMKKNLFNIEKLIMSSYKEGVTSLATLIYGKLTPDTLEYGQKYQKQPTLTQPKNNNINSNNTSINANSLSSTTPASAGATQTWVSPRVKEAFSGILEVLNSNKWKRRWVVLKNNFIFIFKTSGGSNSNSSTSISSTNTSGSSAAGTGGGADTGESIAKSLAKVYRIERSTAETVQPSEAGGRDFCFRIGGIPLVFCAPRAELVSEWISAIKKTMPWFEVGNKALSNTYSVRIFDVSPSDLATRDPSGIDPFLPSFFCVLVDSLIKWKLGTEGLFRISANPSDVRTLRSKFETSPRAVDVDISGEDAHCIASLLKSWLRQLPPFVDAPEDQPILDFIAEHPELTQGSVLLEFRRIIKKAFLPSNLAVLKKLCELIIKVAANEKMNKMSLNNIYVCLIPALNINTTILGYFVKHFRILFGDL